MEKYVIIWHVFNLRYKCGYMVGHGLSKCTARGDETKPNAGLLGGAPPARRRQETTATSYIGGKAGRFPLYKLSIAATTCGWTGN